jgi:hypothetical protein
MTCRCRLSLIIVFASCHVLLASANHRPHHRPDQFDFEFVSSDGDTVGGADGRPRYQAVVYREDPVPSTEDSVQQQKASDGDVRTSNDQPLPAATSILKRADLPNIVFILADDQDIVLEGMVTIIKKENEEDELLH